MEFGFEMQDAPPVLEGASSALSTALSSHVGDVPESILKFANQLNMKLSHTKSQRKFGPARYVDLNWEPEKGSEVFVGRLPWNCDERELVPFLEQAGSVFQIRLMTEMTKSGGGVGRGYCFVKYFTPDQAKLAVSMLHHQCIREGWPVVVSTNIENCRLVVFGVPSYMTAEHVGMEMRKFGDVRKVELVCGDLTITPVPDGLAYVTFANHRAAALARRKMLTLKPLLLWGKLIYVDWAEPEGILQAVTQTPNQYWSLVEESHQVAEVPVAVELLPFPAQPAYPLMQQVYPLIPVYYVGDQCTPPPVSPEITVQEGPVEFFPGNVQYSSSPFIIQPAEEVFWYFPSPPPPPPFPLAQQIYFEGCEAVDNIIWT